MWVVVKACWLEVVLRWQRQSEAEASYFEWSVVAGFHKQSPVWTVEWVNTNIVQSVKYSSTKATNSVHQPQVISDVSHTKPTKLFLQPLDFTSNNLAKSTQLLNNRKDRVRLYRSLF
jgi:hypothetical protein